MLIHRPGGVIAEAIQRARAHLEAFQQSQELARTAIVGRVHSNPVSPSELVISVKNSTGLDTGTVQNAMWSLVQNGALTLTVDLKVAKSADSAVEEEHLPTE